MAVNVHQKSELEAMIHDLEEENRTLQAEYDRLRTQQEHNNNKSQIEDLPGIDGEFPSHDAEMLAEAKLLRQHKGRLEARMRILEDHNRQLEGQLQRFRHLLDVVRNLMTLQAEYDRLRTQQEHNNNKSQIEDLPGIDGEFPSHDAEMLAEANLLRQHKGRLEARMRILEDHNRQLEGQLQRLRHLLDVSGEKSVSLSSSTHGSLPTTPSSSHSFLPQENREPTPGTRIFNPQLESTPQINGHSGSMFHC
ncbi:dystrophin-like [Mya arenaria]|uniref:dystrophin-like n=1 Tax=Mya arenaria TaxID=6604 RepID=UPI0022E58CB8|nr:dystrophin-like [Mya arenaria]